MPFLVALVFLAVGFAVGWFFVGPMLQGYPPFTSPSRAVEIDRERRNRR